jgi:hypothetical protein
MPCEVGSNLAKNEGQKPRAPRHIAGYSSLKASSGSTATGPGTPSPKLKASASGVGNGGVKGAPGGAKRAAKVIGPKYGSGPGGIGESGTGAPWG